MRYLFIFLICISSLFAVENSILKEFPASEEQVIEFTSTALKDFDEHFLTYKEQSLDHLDFTKTVTGWNDVIEPLFLKAATLSFLPLITKNLELLQKANLEVQQMQQRLFVAMNDPKALSIFLHFAKDLNNQKSMTPYQIYIVDHILKTIGEDPLKPSLSSYKTQSFIYAKGDHKEKNLPGNRELTILSWNVCFLEGNVSMLFGGVLPWQQRIERIISKIQTLNPDILCLQEVFSPNAGVILVEKLKSQYAHFYYNMGPNPAGFSIESLGIPGGLFVASKYPLKKENFIPYTKEETPPSRAYGFFTAEIYSEDKPLACLVTTHLQPGSEIKDREYRALQTTAILTALKKVEIPTLLCGDLNIEKTSTEAQELFKSYKSGLYQGLDWTCCELRDYWWKSDQNSIAFKKLPPEKEWLDYFFYLKNSSKLAPHLFTEVLVVNDLTHPEKALSDHQILFTTITLKKL
ncbi:MAG: endonuclease/exonuclease/phosphatase family protein [Chlamydiota bacterium]